MLKSMLKAMQENDTVSIETLVNILDLKERSVREGLRILKEDGLKNDFTIQTLPKIGYALKIENIQKFTQYYDSLQDTTSNNRSSRMMKILYLLLHQEGYVPVQKIADYLQVSRQTVIVDLENINEFIEPFNLKFDSKSHYGVRICGDERDLRHAFSRYVINSQEYISNTLPYLSFIHEENYDDLESHITSIVKNHNIEMSQQSLDSIIDHIKVLLYRVTRENYIENITLSDYSIHESFKNLAKDIVVWIERNHNITIPFAEVDYLASQIAGRTSIESIPENLEFEIKNRLEMILAKMDEEYLTEFSKDEILIQSLLMHMYPLKSRIAHRIKLNNPLIEEVSSRYANVFLVALRFVELWNEYETLDLNRDEVGYLALHFASNIERQKASIINQYRNIAVISELGRGNVFLLKHKLETVFPNANITAMNAITLNDIESMAIDLVLSTHPQKISEKSSIPFLVIPEITNDEHLIELKEALLLKSKVSSNLNERNVVIDLLHEGLFTVEKSNDYMKSIEEMAKKMVNLKFADPSFPQQVVERELKFSTIYSNGIAGPHGMTLNAIRECLGIIIFPKNTYYNNRNVRIAFLINIKKGNLFLYREISRFILSVMNHADIIADLEHCESIESLSKIIKKVKY